jgi:hypothetical protein
MCYHVVDRDYFSFTFPQPNATVHRTVYMVIFMCQKCRSHCSPRSCPKTGAEPPEQLIQSDVTEKGKQLASLTVFTLPRRRQFRLCSCPFIIVTNDFQVWPLQGSEWELDASVASMLLQITAGPDVSGLKNVPFFN